jgi:hypothetical protein
MGLLEVGQHASRLLLRGSGIANGPSRDVAHARIENVGQPPWNRVADLVVHAHLHLRHLLSTRYHVEGRLRYGCSARPIKVAFGINSMSKSRRKSKALA